MKKSDVGLVAQARQGDEAAFEQLVRPALLHQMRARRLFRPRVRGTLETDVSTDPQRTGFVRVWASFDGGGWRAGLSGGQSSNMLAPLARADAFAVIPAGTGMVAAGAEVYLEMFRWPETRSMEEVLGVSSRMISVQPYNGKAGHNYLFWRSRLGRVLEHHSRFLK